MKYIKETLLVYFVILTSIYHSQAQVKFKLQLLNDGITYEASILPETNYRPPLNVTSTAQVTIKVPTGTFEVQNLKNIQPNVEWQVKLIAVSPLEAEGFDYICFELTTNGTEWLRYEAGIEIPVFTFENALDCSGEVSLMDNASDPFMPPNSQNKNVGNQITVAGANGDAYVGNALNSIIPCGQLTTKVEELINSKDIRLIPNPVTNKLIISFYQNQFKQKADFRIYNMVGIPVLSKDISLIGGDSQYLIDVSMLPKGKFFIQIKTDRSQLIIDDFLKL